MQNLKVAQLLPGSMELVGALAVDARPQGLSPRRLPDWTRAQVPPLLETVLRMPSGVRLRFRTNSTRIGVTLLATNMVTPPAQRRPITCSLQYSNQLLQASSDSGHHILLDRDDPGAHTLKRGEAGTLWFENLPSSGTEYELWLPHNAFCELREIHIEPGAEIGLAQADSRPVWAHYGSSISHCMEAEYPALTWPAVAARQAGASLRSFGFGGQCHLDQFIARTLRDLTVDVISAKVGINIINMDSMRERVFVPALHGFLDTLREGQPETPILLVSPIYCPSAEQQPGPTVPNANGKFVTLDGDRAWRSGCMSLRRVRRLLAELVAARTTAGDQNLHYLDGLSLFGADDSADLPDDLHPNPAGYVRMGERFAPHLKALL